MPPYSNPPALSRTDGGRKYALLVEQQPQRARMCGFGDKDRRPITPPPCVRLVISDAQTGVEIDINSIEHSMYVLNVDLWDEFASREVNLVSHSPTTPHIGSSTASSYAEIPTAMAHSYNPGVLPGAGNPAMLPNSGRPQMQQMYPPGNPSSDVATYNAPYNPYPGPPQVSAYSQPQQPNGNGHYAPISQQQYPPRPQGLNDYGPGQHNGYHHPPINGYGHGPQSAPPQQGYYGNQHYIPTGEVAPRNQSSLRAPTDYIPNGEVAPRNQSSLLQYNNGRPGFEPQTRPVSSTPPSGMYTRNLIGSLSASAFRLTDVNERIGIWFVLQDLSVRTEGSFRLRFSFVNVGLPSTAPDGTPANNGTNSIINTGKAPVLAQTFSDVFVVYSAKRFPGVVESTPLSKCFATQGIKIPIRKDAQNSRANGANGANRDDEDEEY